MIFEYLVKFDFVLLIYTFFYKDDTLYLKIHTLSHFDFKIFVASNVYKTSDQDKLML